MEMDLHLPVAELLAWYERHRRPLPWRETRDIYAVWVSEVMLQQTRVPFAGEYYRRFLQRFPDVAALAAAERGDVLKAWEGLGYYSRAGNLHRAAAMVLERHGGVVPTTYDEFRALPGVGEYIAAAVLSIACATVVPVIDGNVLRVCSRCSASAADLHRPAGRRLLQAALRRLIPPDNPGDFNQALMEIGALICLPRRPACASCPLACSCRAHQQGRTAEFPPRRAKKEIPVHTVAVAVIVRDGRFYVQQRPPHGHLGGLWEFPGGKKRADETLEQALVRECREELGVVVRVGPCLGTVRHQYSHFGIVLSAFVCTVDDDRDWRAAAPGRWIDVTGIAALPFPAANHKLFPALHAHLDAAGGGGA